MDSSSDFFLPENGAADWSHLSLLATRQHALLYTAKRYGRSYVLKALPEDVRHLTDYRLQQEREFHVGLMLHHPGIVETYSLEEIAPLGRCIVIELVEGYTLAQWLDTRPHFRQRLRLWRQLEDAMDYLRSRQTEHHDLKTDNILVTQDGRYLKLIDFGLSGTPEGRSDEQDMRRMIRLFFPSAWQRMVVCHERLLRILPLLAGALLLCLSLGLYGLSRHEQAAEKARYEQAIAETHRLLDGSIQTWEEDIDQAATRADAYSRLAADITASWQIRDSLMALYPEPDPLNYAIFDIWTKEGAATQTRLMQKAAAKPM